MTPVNARGVARRGAAWRDAAWRDAACIILETELNHNTRYHVVHHDRVRSPPAP
jgi:hypothetical protein